MRTVENDITLILGGARSGKSSFAERLAIEARLPVTYIATADVRDEEMARRVEFHKKRRPAEWDTWEGAPDDLPSTISGMRGVLLLDCLTFWLSRLCFASGIEDIGEDEWNLRELAIQSLAKRLCEAPADGARLIIVSNEVGFGLVPPNVMGRRFRDLQGRVNQLTALRSRRVALVVAGCPLWVKNIAEVL